MEMETIADTLSDAGFMPTHKLNRKFLSTQQISQKPESGAETEYLK